MTFPEQHSVKPHSTKPIERLVSDALFDSLRLRVLTVVDAFTREAPAIDVDEGIKGEQVVAAMTRIAWLRGAPGTICVDNGPEVILKALGHQFALLLAPGDPGSSKVATLLLASVRRLF